MAGTKKKYPKRKILEGRWWYVDDGKKRDQLLVFLLFSLYRKRKPTIETFNIDSTTKKEITDELVIALFIEDITKEITGFFLAALCFSFPENSRFVPSDKKQVNFCGIINGGFTLVGTVFCRSKRKK